MVQEWSSDAGGVEQPAGGERSLRDFLEVRYLITPGLLAIIWIVGAAFITLASIVAFTQQGLVEALLLLVMGNLFWRVWIEIVIVVFRIHDSLRSIERRGRGL
jgi:hypothetical protein